MFVENASSALRTPEGRNVPPSPKFYQIGRLTLHPSGVRQRNRSSLQTSHPPAGVPDLARGA
jgi:hypothetical protein